MSYRKKLLQRCVATALLSVLGLSNCFAQNNDVPVTGLWNGFQSQLNVVECIQNGGTQAQLSLLLRDSNGNDLLRAPFSLAANGTTHLIVNSLIPTSDRYGSYLIDAVSPTSTEYYCHTAIYRTDSHNNIEYAFSLPMLHATSEPTSGIFNTLHPDPNEAIVFNWLTLINPESTPISLTIQLFDQQGEPLETITRSNLAPGTREDISLHSGGPRVGLYRISSSNSGRYISFLTRFAPERRGFSFAIPLRGTVGTNTPGPLAASTMGNALNWGEIANLSDSPQQVIAEVRDRNGVLLNSSRTNYTLNAHAQRHIYLNQFIGEENVGTFSVRCANPTGCSILSQSLFYGRRQNNTLEWGYASQGLGQLAHGGNTVIAPLNTFFNAANWNKVLNATSSPLSISATVYDNSGAELNTRVLNAAGYGALDIGYHEVLGQNQVGLATKIVSASDARYTSELLRVFLDASGRITYIMNIPSAVFVSGSHGDSNSSSSEFSSSSSHSSSNSSAESSSASSSSNPSCPAAAPPSPPTVLDCSAVESEGAVVATVSSTTALNSALASATTTGGTILLAPGNYGTLILYRYNPIARVTLRSVDNTNPATFTLIDISQSNSVRLDSVRVVHIRQTGEPEFLRAVDVRGSHHIEILNSTFSGSADGIPDNDTYGVGTSEVNDFLFANNTVSNFVRGLILGAGDRLRVCGSRFHTLRSDGVDLGGVVDALVEGNSFTNFYQYGEDHPDAIQAFNEYAVRNMENVTIRGNTILRGSGQPSQSILVQANSACFRNRNFLIERNVIYQGIIHGISVADTDGVRISHNTVLTDFNPDHAHILILTHRTRDAVVENNVTTGLSSAEDVNHTSSSNIVAQYEDPRQNTHYDALFLNSGAGANASREDFMPRPGSILIRSGDDIGALEFNFTPDALTAYIVTDTSRVATNEQLQFDGSLSNGAHGTITSYQWDFGDGNFGSGAIIAHAYSVPGTYTASLTVTNTNSEVDSETKTIIVTPASSPDSIVFLDFDGHFQDTSGHSNDAICPGYCPSFETSPHGQAVAMTPTSDYLVVPYNYTLDGMQNLSVAFWARQGGSTGGGTILHKHASYWLELRDGILRGYLYNQAGRRLDIAVGVGSDNTWHHYVLTYDGTHVLTYKDGMPQSDQTFAGSIYIDNSRDLNIGHDYGSNTYNGALDQLRLFSRALTLTEVQALAQ